MRTKIRRPASLTGLPAIFALALFVAGCPDSAPPPPAFVGCGNLTAGVTGQFGIGSVAPTDISTRAGVKDGASSVTWQVPQGATGRAFDGVPASGPIPDAAPRSFTATGTSGQYLLTVTGSLTGPPVPCTGSGSWVVTLIDGGRVVGRGRWSIP